MWRNHSPVGEVISHGQQPAGGGSGAELGDTVGTSARVYVSTYICEASAVQAKAGARQLP